METAYEKLSKKDKDMVEKEAHPFGKLWPTYRRMLAVFEPMGAGLVGTELDADQLIRILKAKKYKE